MKFTKLDAEKTAYFQQFYPEHTVIGYLLEEDPDSVVDGRVVLKSKPGCHAWTPTGCARDCGDHYIIARYCSYDRVDKDTMKITKDVHADS